MKQIAKTLALLLALALMISGCASGTETASDAPAGDAASTATAAPAADAATEAPADAAAPADGRPQLEVALRAEAFVTEYDDNYFTKYLEDYNNIDIVFYMLPAEESEMRTKLSLMVTAQDDMPDVVISNGMTDEMVLDYGTKGAFIPLDDYLNDPEKAPNFTAVAPEDKALMLQMITSADGHIYSLPKFEPETWNFTPSRMRINEGWLKKLNLEMPTTTDELATVLAAFVNNDPNGNGQKDEIGVYGWYAGGYGENVIAPLMGSFEFNNNFGKNQGLTLDPTGTTVIAPYMQEGWKQGLIYLNQLYNDGLLAASMFTDDQTQYRAILNSDPNIVGLTAAGSNSNWPDYNNNQNFIDLGLLPPLKGPTGLATSPYSDYVPEQVFFITSNCADPDLAFRFGDSFLNKEVSMVARNGEEGVDWTRDEAVRAKHTNGYIEAGLYDEISFVTLTEHWSNPGNRHWRNINPRYADLTSGNTSASEVNPYDAGLPSEKYNVPNFQLLVPAHPEFILPLLRYNVEDAQAIAEPIVTITTFAKQTTAEFITGARPIEESWDQYLQELDSMGMQEWLAAAQAAFDRAN